MNSARKRRVAPRESPGAPPGDRTVPTGDPEIDHGKLKTEVAPTRPVRRVAAKRPVRPGTSRRHPADL